MQTRTDQGPVEATQTDPDLKGNLVRLLRVPHGRFGRIVAWTIPKLDTPADVSGVTAQLLDLRHDDDVLEVSCGNGSFLRKHGSRARSISGLDPSDVAIEAAISANRGRVARGEAEFVIGDPASLPWPEARFSAACVLFMFMSLPEPEATLAELRRVLRPGGRVIVSAPCNAICNAGEAAWWRMRLWTMDGLGAAMWRAGFTQVRGAYVPLPGLPKAIFMAGSVGDLEVTTTDGSNP
jgi:SAM-dependent methyltransferase